LNDEMAFSDTATPLLYSVRHGRSRFNIIICVYVRSHAFKRTHTHLRVRTSHARTRTICIPVPVRIKCEFVAVDWRICEYTYIIQS